MPYPQHMDAFDLPDETVVDIEVEQRRAELTKDSDAEVEEVVADSSQVAQGPVGREDDPGEGPSSR